MSCVPNLGNQLIGMLIDTAQQSVDALRNRVSNVRLAPLQIGIDRGCECILFEMDGKTFIGEMRGRNRDLCIDLQNRECEVNRAIALRVLLDRHATPFDTMHTC